MDTPAIRNNNPGNLKDPSSGQFRQFPSAKEGYASLLNDLEAKKTGNTSTGLGPHSTLIDFASKYAPKSDNNNPAQYAATIANEMGVRPDAALGELDTAKWAAAVAKAEDRNSIFANQKMVESQAPNLEVTLPQNRALEPKDGDNKSLLRKGAEFAFPILEKKERTPLQVAGDVGLSALWFVPGAGTAASAALRGLGVGAKAAKTAGLIGTGAATGYAADVAGGLSEGEDLGEAAKPGLGTLVGAGTAGLLSKVGSKYSQTGVIDSLANENASVIGQTKKGAQKLSEAYAKKKDIPKFLADKGVNLKQLIDSDTVSYATKDEATKLFTDARKANTLVTEALSRIKGTGDITKFTSDMVSKSPKNKPEMVDIIRNEMDLFKKQYGPYPTLADINEWKQRMWDMSRFDMAVPGETRKTYRMIGNYLKNQVESLAKKQGVKDIDKMNEFIGMHLEAADMLSRLHGTKAKGGRLGNILLQNSLGTLGGVGGFFGGGPVGSLLGIIAGHYGANAVAALIRKTEGKPIQSAILKRIEKETPDIVRKFEALAKQSPKELASIKKQLAEEGIDIFKPSNTKGPSLLKAKEENSGKVPGILTTLGARMGAQ